MSSGNDADMNQRTAYQIRMKGHLGPQWKEWFEGVSISLEAGGEALLTSDAIDQAALQGLLKKLFGLGITVISVNRLDP